MSETPVMVGFKYGDFNALPDSTTNGTIYVAKAADGKAYMYVDKNGEKLNITSPNATFYGVAEWVDEETINVNLDGFTLEIGSQITIKMPGWYDTNDIATAVTTGVTYLTINDESKMQLAMRDNAIRPLLTNSIWTFVYDGNSWQLIGEVDTTNNGITLFQSTNPSLQGATDTGGLWSSNPAPLLVGNVAAVSAGQAQAYFPSIKAFYAEGKTPTLDADGRLRVPSGYMTIGSTGTYSYPYLNIESDYVCNGWGPGCVSISSEYINWYDYDGNAGCYLYLNDDGIALGSINYGSKFANISDSETWFANSIHTDGYVYDMVGRLPHVYYGTAAPSSSTGQNGDIYIMYS